MEKTPLSSYLADYRSALEKLRNFGLQHNGTRLERYERTLQRCVEDEKRGSDEHHGQPSLLNALIESNEILLAATLPVHALETRAALLRIKVVSKGTDVVTRDGNDPGRDALVELSTAAALNSVGDFGFFTEDAYDISTRVDQTPIECKRITSVKSIRNRLRDARIQLSTAASDGENPGVIVMDLTRPIYVQSGVLSSASDEDLMDEAESRLRSYLANYVFNPKILSTIDSSSVLGLLVRATFIGVSGERMNARRFVSWQALCTHPDESEETERFLLIASKFSPKKKRRGTTEDLSQSTQKYPPNLDA